MDGLEAFAADLSDNEDQIELEREVCGRILHRFFLRAWEVLNPGEEFQAGWHAEAICESLQAVTNGEIKRLIINIPPRFTKSTIVSQCWPAWVWAKKPSLKWLFCSYAEDLALRDAVACRRLTKHPWYRDRWGDRWDYQEDSNIKHRMSNTEGGVRFSTGVAAQLMGEGGDILVIDDPHATTDMYSKDVLKKTRDWFDQGFMTRMNNLKTSRIVIIMQRLHEMDLAAHAMEKGGWEHLNLPNEYNPRKHCVIPAINFEDPRGEDVPEGKWHRKYEIGRGEGALLCPERLGDAECVERKLALGPVAYQAQYNQEPVPPGGSFFRKEWFGSYAIRGDFIDLVTPGGIIAATIHRSALVKFITADTASTLNTSSDYTVISVWGVAPGGWLLWLDCVRGKFETPEVKRKIKTTSAAWGASAVLIEYASTGIGIVQDLLDEGCLNVRGVSPTTDLEQADGLRLKASDKVSRASIAQILCYNERVLLPQFLEFCPWVNAWVMPELLAFNVEMTHAHDDVVDTLSYAAMHMHQTGGLLTRAVGSVTPVAPSSTGTVPNVAATKSPDRGVPYSDLNPGPIPYPGQTSGYGMPGGAQMVGTVRPAVN